MPCPSVWGAEIRSAGALPEETRCFLTLVMAMDRSRAADRLWRIAAETYHREPWLFQPGKVTNQPPERVRELLRATGISQRHGADSTAWLRISAALTLPEIAPDLHRAVYAGEGDANVLRRIVRVASGAEGFLFPLLRGPRTSILWVRLLALLGRARITNLRELPVSVNVQTRKLTKYIGVTDTGHLPEVDAIPRIERAWHQATAEVIGPQAIAGTAAALDPALWFYGKWGCTYCENLGRREPIGRACKSCRFPNRG